MKFNLIAILLVASLANDSEAFFFRRFGFGFGRGFGGGFGGGFGRGFGRFGFGRFGFGGFGGMGFRRFGLGLPIPVPVPVPVPVAMIRPFLGKRSIENMTVQAEPLTSCNLTTVDLQMKCKG